MLCGDMLSMGIILPRPNNLLEVAVNPAPISVKSLSATEKGLSIFAKKARPVWRPRQTSVLLWLRLCCSKTLFQQHSLAVEWLSFFVQSEGCQYRGWEMRDLAKRDGCLNMVPSCGCRFEICRTAFRTASSSFRC